MVSGKTAFEHLLRYIANCNIAGKTEVSMEFSNFSPASSAGPKSVLTKNMGDELTEIWFFVPGNFSKLKGSDVGSQILEDENEEEIIAVQVFHDTIKEKAEIGQVTGDLILSFEEVLVLTPRGRYDMDMFPDFLRLRGKTYDYKVLYQSIAQLFLVPKDDQHVLFILRLLFQIFLQTSADHPYPAGSEQANSTGSNIISIPGDAVYSRRGDHKELNMSEWVVYEIHKLELSILFSL